jgi:arylsulfatase A-like enzyme
VTENLVLITIDDLSAGSINLTAQGGKTPNLSELAANSLSNHYAVDSSSPGSFRSIFSGQRPLEFNDYDSLSGERLFFPEILRENGVETVGINTNPHTSAFFGFDRGFDRFIDLTDSDSPAEKSYFDKFVNFMKSTGPIYRAARKLFRKYQDYDLPYEVGENVTKKAKEEIESLGDEESFVWIHYMDVHEPFLLPKDKMGKNSDFEGYKNLAEAREILAEIKNNSNLVRKLYDDCIYYVDEQIGEFLDFLETQDEEFDLVIASDHGELLEHFNGDLIGHKPLIVSKEQFHVPFMIRSEREIGADGITCHLDIAPTVLELFGLEVPEDMEGHSLFSNFNRKNLVVETASEMDKSFLKDYSTYQLGVVSKKGLTVDPSDSFEKVAELRKEYDQKAKIFGGEN